MQILTKPESATEAQVAFILFNTWLKDGVKERRLFVPPTYLRDGGTEAIDHEADLADANEEERQRVLAQEEEEEESEPVNEHEHAHIQSCRTATFDEACKLALDARSVVLNTTAEVTAASLQGMVSLSPLHPNDVQHVLQYLQQHGYPADDAEQEEIVIADLHSDGPAAEAPVQQDAMHGYDRDGFTVSDGGDDEDAEESDDPGPMSQEQADLQYELFGPEDDASETES